ncbi:MAG TPA: CocE/NonD family hydrolase [Xanthobacteraceae bacterium]
MEEEQRHVAGLPGRNDVPPVAYDRPPAYRGMITEKDVAVPMRDGVNLSVDVYRPDAKEKFPALLAFAIYNKDFQGPDIKDVLPPQPSWSSLWMGPIEAGDTKFLTSRGYVHIIGSPRGVGKSDGGGSREWDSYDLIEWIAKQPWCDGNVGMVGISGFGAEQFHVARQNPPHLKAIFPYDPRGAYGTLGSFREEYPGAMLHLFRYLVAHFSAIHQNKGKPGPLPPEKEAHWREAMNNPDYKMYPHLYNVITQRGQHMPPIFEMLIDPYDKEEVVRAAEQSFERIKIPAYTGAGWYGYTYKTHLNGAQSYFEKIKAPKKLLFAGPTHLERPFHTMHAEILRWYDHWLKGIDTGIMDEPPVRYWLMGANEWRSGTDWPLPETQWTKFYLNSWERLQVHPFVAASAEEELPPDAFVQMPPTQTNKVAKLRYLSEPLPYDVVMVGASVLNLFAAIDQEDTNWIVTLKDVGPDVSVRTVREGEREIPDDLRERELTRGWLKASHRALDPSRSKPWRPWHPLTRSAQKKVVPGEITEYSIEIMATANLFRRGHRICLEIASADMPTGVAGATNVEYIAPHVSSSKTTLHKIYHDERRPSHLLLPIIPQ